MCGGNDTTKQTSQQQTKQTYKPAPEAQAAYSDVLSKAQHAASLPYTPITQQIAGLTPEQMQAMTSMQNVWSTVQPYMTNAAQLFQQAASPMTASDINAFYNPYADAVTKNLQETFGQQFRDMTGKLTGAAGGTGADRIAVAQAEALRQNQLAAGQTYAGIWQNALQAAQNQRGIEQASAYGLGNLGTSMVSDQLAAAQSLFNAGVIDQQTLQNVYNATYTQKMQEQAFPYQQAQWYAGVVDPTAGAMGGTWKGTGTGNQTYNPPNPSPVSQIAGTGIAAASLFAKDGGAVKGYDVGGAPTIGGSPYSNVGGYIPSMAGLQMPSIPQAPAMQIPFLNPQSMGGVGGKGSNLGMYKSAGQGISNLWNKFSGGSGPEGNMGWTTTVSPTASGLGNMIMNALPFEDGGAVHKDSGGGFSDYASMFLNPLFNNDKDKTGGVAGALGLSPIWEQFQHPSPFSVLGMPSGAGASKSHDALSGLGKGSGLGYILGGLLPGSILDGLLSRESGGAVKGEGYHVLSHLAKGGKANEIPAYDTGGAPTPTTQPNFGLGKGSGSGSSGMNSQNMMNPQNMMGMMFPFLGGGMGGWGSGQGFNVKDFISNLKNELQSWRSNFQSNMQNTTANMQNNLSDWKSTFLGKDEGGGVEGYEFGGSPSTTPYDLGMLEDLLYPKQQDRLLSPFDSPTPAVAGPNVSDMPKTDLAYPPAIKIPKIQDHLNPELAGTTDQSLSLPDPTAMPEMDSAQLGFTSPAGAMIPGSKTVAGKVYGPNPNEEIGPRGPLSGGSALTMNADGQLPGVQLGGQGAQGSNIDNILRYFGPGYQQPTLFGHPMSNSRLALLAAGLGIMGGTSPYAMTNIGQGGLEGMKALQDFQKMDADRQSNAMTAWLSSQRLGIEQQNANLAASMRPAQLEEQIKRNGFYEGKSGDEVEKEIQDFRKSHKDWYADTPELLGQDNEQAEPTSGEQPKYVGTPQQQRAQLSIDYPEGVDKSVAVPLHAIPKHPELWSDATGKFSQDIQKKQSETILADAKKANDAATQADITWNNSMREFNGLDKHGLLMPGPFFNERVALARLSAFVKNATVTMADGTKQAAFSPQQIEAMNKIGPGEALIKYQTRMGFDLARTLGTREAMQVIQQALAAVQNGNLTPSGFLAISYGVKAGIDHDKERFQYINDWGTSGKGNVFGADAVFDRHIGAPEKYSARADIMNKAANSRYYNNLSPERWNEYKKFMHDKYMIDPEYEGMS